MESAIDYTKGGAVNLTKEEYAMIMLNLGLIDDDERDEARGYLLFLNIRLQEKGSIEEVFAEVTEKPLKKQILLTRLLAQMHSMARVS